MGRITGELKTVRVTVPENTVVEQGKFYLLDGYIGMAVSSVTTGPGETKPVILVIDPGVSIETSQVNPADTMAVGADLYWDEANKRFTETATGNRYAAKVCVAKDANNVVEIKLVDQSPDTMRQAAAQANSTAADVATLVADFNALLAKLRAAGIMAS